MGKPVASKLTKGLAVAEEVFDIVKHFVLFADGFPVHSSHDLEEVKSEKINHAYDARRGGKPTPRFHVVQRDIHDDEDHSHDTIIEGDEENPPAGMKKLKGKVQQ